MNNKNKSKKKVVNVYSKHKRQVHRICLYGFSALLLESFKIEVLYFYSCNYSILQKMCMGNIQNMLVYV